MKKNNFRYRKKMNKMTFRLVVSSVLLAVCVGLASFLIIFHVKDVEIIGNTRNTEEEVKELVLKGPFSANSFLISLMKKNIETPDLPFVESIQVEMVSSHKIRIHVNEKQIVGYVRFLDCNMFFDKDGMVVESQVAPDVTDILEAETVDPDEIIAPEEVVDEHETTFHAAVTDVPLIKGLTFDYVAIDAKLPVEDEQVFNTVLGITRIVDKYEIQPDWVEFDEDYRITLYYGTVRVTLGKDDLLEEKITRVAAILPKLTGKSGVLHMEDYMKGTTDIIFTEDIPEDELLTDDTAAGEDSETEDLEEDVMPGEGEDLGEDEVSEGESSEDDQTMEESSEEEESQDQQE